MNDIDSQQLKFLHEGVTTHYSRPAAGQALLDGLHTRTVPLKGF